MPDEGEGRQPGAAAFGSASKLFTNRLLDSAPERDPDHSTARMLVRNRLLQATRIRQHPGVGISIPSQLCFGGTHPGLGCVLAKYAGGKRADAIDDFTRPGNRAGTARN